MMRRLLVAAVVIAVGVGAYVIVDSTRGSGSAGASRTAQADLTQRVQNAVGAVAPVQVAIAARNTATGQTFTFGPTSGMITASVSKLDVLEALLVTHEQAHTDLSADDDQLATAMIENSDNDSGQTLWNEVGSAAGMSAANKTLGLTHTVPDPQGYYGLTTTGPEDEVSLLGHLVGTPGPLDAASQAYALQLLHNVEADQTWGVTAAADPGSVSAVKNGWLAIDSDGERWAVNSDGIITVQGQQLLISIMTQHDADEQSGIDLVESLAKIVAPALVRR